jgi:hypothetical protein
LYVWPSRALYGERRRLRLDRDPAFALEIHRVQHLLLHLARGQAATALDEPVRQRRFAVVDVSNDGKVADQVHVVRRLRPGQNKGAPNSAPDCTNHVEF